jgi:osmoprotectant transport system substrate-binding protein
MRGRGVGVVLIAILAIGAADCGSDRPPIRAAGFDFPESHVLAWIFAIAFEDAGFDVDTSRIQPGRTREILKPALEDGEIDYLPEYTGTLLSVLGGQPTASSDGNYEAARELFAGRGVTLLPYAPAQDQNVFVVTPRFAAERGVSSLSDLATIADELTFGAPPECPQRQFCAIGLRDVYGIEFDEFIPLDATSRASALASGAVDVVLLFSTDAVLAINDWVVLEDDRELIPAENVSLAVRDELIAEYGDDLTEIVAAISRELTTEALSELNRQVQIEGRDPQDVAREWLEQRALIED